VVADHPRWREVALLWFVQISMTLVYVVFTLRHAIVRPPIRSLLVFGLHADWLWRRFQARNPRLIRDFIGRDD